MIDYKGYTALLEVDVPSGAIVGHVIGIRDEIVFQGRTVEEAAAGFHEAVDFYLGRLGEAGQAPERPFSGRFNVRIDPPTHRGLVLDAEARKLSLNDVVRRAFAAYLEVVAVRDGGVRNEATGREPADAAVTAGDPMLSLEVRPTRPKRRVTKLSAKRSPGTSVT